MLFSDGVNGGVHFVLPSAVLWVLNLWKPLRKSIFLSSNSTYPACVIKLFFHTDGVAISFTQSHLVATSN